MTAAVESAYIDMFTSFRAKMEIYIENGTLKAISTSELENLADKESGSAHVPSRHSGVSLPIPRWLPRVSIQDSESKDKELESSRIESVLRNDGKDIPDAKAEEVTSILKPIWVHK